VKVIFDAPADRRWMHAYTYSGHPTACAVGLANLEVIEKENLIAEAARKGRKLLEGMRRLSSLDGVKEVRGFGLMAGIEFIPAPGRKTGARVQQECIKRGLFSRIREDIFMLAPPFVITDDQIDRMLNILGEAIPIAVKG
jgi:adenosylmethionine-8-amino-7-oxononanoate aminotransferase